MPKLGDDWFCPTCDKGAEEHSLALVPARGRKMAERRWVEAEDCRCDHPGCDPDYGHFGPCLHADDGLDEGSLTDQFWRAHKLVTDAGLYDVADWMAARWFGPDRTTSTARSGALGNGGLEEAP